MKKILSSFALFIAFSIMALGQNQSDKVDIKWGNEIEASRRKTLSDIIAHDETGFYAIQTERKGLLGFSSDLSIDHYDYKANQTKSIDLKLEDGKKERVYENIIHMNGTLYLFTSYLDQKTKRNILYVQTINKTTLLPNSDIKKIVDIDYAGERKSNSGDFTFTLSRDFSKLLVFYNLPFEKGAKDKFGFSVFDNTMNPIWSKNVTLPYNDELFDIERQKVDNQGNVYLLNTVYKEKRRKKRHGEPNYQYTILSYKQGVEAADEFKVDLAGKFLTDMQFAITNNQDIVCAGFYSDQGTYSIKGSYFISIDGKTKEIKSQSFKEFSIDVLFENLTEKQQKKVAKRIEKGKEVEMYEYDLDNLILRDDGGAMLVGEQYFVNVVTTTQTVSNGTSTSTTTTTTYYYNYNDIIVVNINPTGQIEWVKKIPKRQVTANDGGFFSSYAMSVVKDKLFFLFNDNPKNLLEKTADSKKYANFSGQKGSVVVLVEMDKDGNYTKEALFKAVEAEVMIRPKVCEQTSKGEMVIFGQRKKTQRFAKLTFN